MDARSSPRPALKAFLILSMGMVIAHQSALAALLLTLGTIGLLYRLPLRHPDKRLLLGLLLAGAALERGQSLGLPPVDAALPRLGIAYGTITRPIRHYPEHWAADLRLMTSDQRDTGLRLRILSHNTVALPLEGATARVTGRFSPLRHPRNPGEIAWDASLHRRSGLARFWVTEIDTSFIRPSSLSSLAVALRTHIGHTLLDIVGGQEGILARAILLGLRDRMDRDTLSSFREAGIVHVLAVSGLHVGIIAVMLVYIGTLILPGYRAPALFGLIGLISYVCLVGPFPSVLRASVMAGAVLLGIILGKRADPANSVGLAGLILLLLKPEWLWEAGFQLSFGATLGILLLTPKLTPNTTGLPRPLRWIITAVAASLGAQIGILPVVLYHFHQWPSFGLLANLPAVALMTVLLWASVATILANVVWHELALLIGTVTRAAAHTLIELARRVANLPGSIIQWGDISCWILLAVWAVALALLLARRKRFAVALAIIVTLNCWLLWGLLDPWEIRRNRLSFLHIDHGNCVVLESQDRNLTVIDPGAPGMARSAFYAATDYLRFRRTESFDQCLTTSSGSHRAGAAGALAAEGLAHRLIGPATAFGDSVEPSTPTHCWTAVASPIISSGFKLIPLGTVTNDLDGLLIEAPNGIRALLLGEQGWQADERLASMPIVEDIEIIYVGPRRSVGPSHLLLRRARPKLVVVGGDDVLEPGALGRLSASGCTVLETTRGAVVLEFNPYEVTWRQP